MIPENSIPGNSVVKEMLIPVINPPVLGVLKDSSAENCGGTDEDNNSD